MRIAPEIQPTNPVVALETSVLAQGLPIPENREALERMMRAVQGAGAVPALTAVVQGTPAIGLDATELDRFLRRDGIHKVSARDLPVAAALGWDGATTVAAAIALAHAAAIEVFATGGIGGVHHDAPFDESADLVELSRTPVIVVCAGAKSILDLPATAERLETLGVPVVGYKTAELPGFFTASTGIPLPAMVTSVTQIVDAWRAHRALGRCQALVVAQGPPPEHALDPETLAPAIADARAQARTARVRGAAVTPFLLDAVTRLTRGGSLRANLASLERNAALAGEIAVALRQRRPGEKARK